MGLFHSNALQNHYMASGWFIYTLLRKCHYTLSYALVNQTHAYYYPVTNGNYPTTYQATGPIYKNFSRRGLTTAERVYDKMKWGLLYHIYPDIDQSREALLQSLQQKNDLIASCDLPFIPSATNRSLLGDQFFISGNFLLLNLSLKMPVKDLLFCP